MSAVVNVALPIPITFYDTDGVGVEGLSVTSSARLAGSATTVSATSSTDRDNGDYDLLYTLTSVGTWRVTSTATIDGETATDITDVQVVTAEQADPAAALAESAADLATSADSVSDQTADLTATIAALTSADVTIVTPIDAVTLNITVEPGVAALLSWSSSGWDDLTGITPTLQAYKTLTGAEVFTDPFGCDVDDAGEATQTINLTLSADDTALLVPGTIYRYEVSSDTDTLASGALSAREG